MKIGLAVLFLTTALMVGCSSIPTTQLALIQTAHATEAWCQESSVDETAKQIREYLLTCYTPIVMNSSTYIRPGIAVNSTWQLDFLVDQSPLESGHRLTVRTAQGASQGYLLLADVIRGEGQCRTTGRVYVMNEFWSRAIPEVRSAAQGAKAVCRKPG